MSFDQLGNKDGVLEVGNANVDDDDTDTLTSMRARLTAIDATLYSSANLDKMSYNDMLYAIRMNDRSSGVG